MMIHNTINISRIKLYINPLLHQPTTLTKPPPISQVYQTGEYEVESILDLKIERRGCRKPTVKMLVKWKGYNKSKSTWKKMEEMKNVLKPI